ncbi:hypothetical protein O181_087412 [Austropuccinia psidii MF-1]|uniref:Uncharacterized protein n=1 Tax=Austropuccinia psidii MF-1 TaxID=1389203 RepID=A0A9Q3IPN4_9BASI|nr:hypothetical protein [Austropuccinia psidii MF-1]
MNGKNSTMVFDPFIEILNFSTSTPSSPSNQPSALKRKKEHEGNQPLAVPTLVHQPLGGKRDGRRARFLCSTEETNKSSKQYQNELEPNEADPFGGDCHRKIIRNQPLIPALGECFPIVTQHQSNHTLVTASLGTKSYTFQFSHLNKAIKSLGARFSTSKQNETNSNGIKHSGECLRELDCRSMPRKPSVTSEDNLTGVIIPVTKHYSLPPTRRKPAFDSNKANCFKFDRCSILH